VANERKWALMVSRAELEKICDALEDAAEFYENKARRLKRQMVKDQTRKYASNLLAFRDSLLTRGFVGETVTHGE
jgi:hypothetical protein